MKVAFTAPSQGLPIEFAPYEKRPFNVRSQEALLAIGTRPGMCQIHLAERAWRRNDRVRQIKMSGSTNLVERPRLAGERAFNKENQEKHALTCIDLLLSPPDFRGAFGLLLTAKGMIIFLAVCGSPDLVKYCISSHGGKRRYSS
jgi:hypothetical protein